MQTIERQTFEVCAIVPIDGDLRNYAVESDQSFQRRRFQEWVEATGANF